MHWPSLPPGISWYSFLEAESTPGHMKLSDALEKNPQWPGIDPGTLRLVAQCLNHYATPGPQAEVSGRFIRLPHYTQKKYPLYSFKKMVGGDQSWSTHCAEERNLISVLRLEVWLFSCLACSLVTIPTTLSCPLLPPCKCCFINWFISYPTVLQLCRLFTTWGKGHKQVTEDRWVNEYGLYEGIPTGLLSFISLLTVSV